MHGHERLLWRISWVAGLALLILAAGCLLRLLAVQRSTITKLRQEIDLLRLQLEAAEQARAKPAGQSSAMLPEDRQPVSEDEVALTFFVKGREQVMKAVVKRIGDEWKFYGGFTF